jgi:hypothetical protein
MQFCTAHLLIFLAGRPQINLNVYKNDLVAMYEAGCTYENLKSWLEDEQDTRASVRIVKKWMQEFGVRKRISRDVEKRVKELVEAYFYE